MNKLFVLIIAVVLIPFDAFSQHAGFKDKYLNSISETKLKKHVYVLASDSLKGRDTGSEGEHKAAGYIAKHFDEYGLKPYNDSSYFQSIGLWTWHWGEFSIKADEQELKHYNNVVYLSSAPIEQKMEAKCIFIGNGSDAIINRINIRNKIVFATVDELNGRFGIARKIMNKGALAVFIVHRSDSGRFSVVSERIRALHRRRTMYRTKPVFGSHLTKIFAVDHAVAESFFGISVDSLNQLTSAHQMKKLPQPVISLYCPVIVEKAKANNVVGYIAGKTETGETLVISAHYDHIGEKHNGIAYGADDNASGTAALLELAKAFSGIKDKLDKNMVFLATSGEEKGLLGGLYFADHPEEHRFNIRADINIDMIGRQDSVHKSNYIYTIGNPYYPEFDSLVNAANTMIEPLTIQYDYNKPQGFGNMLMLSDHYAFHRKGIPILAFFSGLHEDYHKTSDTPDKIDYAEMEHRVKLIFTTAFLAAQKSAFIPQTD